MKEKDAYANDGTHFSDHFKNFLSQNDQVGWKLPIKYIVHSTGGGMRRLNDLNLVKGD